MKLEIKENGYDLVEEYRTEKGYEKHIWHFDKTGKYINRIKERVYESRRKKQDNQTSK